MSDKGLVIRERVEVSTAKWTYDKFIEKWRQIDDLESNCKWARAEMVGSLHRRWGQGQLKMFCADVGMSESRAYEYLDAYNGFTPEERNPDLSFYAHVRIAAAFRDEKTPLPDGKKSIVSHAPDRKRWLKKASRDNLSVRNIERAILAEKSSVQHSNGKPLGIPKFPLPDDLRDQQEVEYEQWLKANVSDGKKLRVFFRTFVKFVTEYGVEFVNPICDAISEVTGLGRAFRVALRARRETEKR